MVERSAAPHILSLGTRQRQVLSFTLRPLYPFYLEDTGVCAKLQGARTQKSTVYILTVMKRSNLIK
jgi:hypothetical protein